MNRRKLELTYPLRAAMKVRETALERAREDLAMRQRELALEEEALRRLEVRRSVLAEELEEASQQLYQPDTGGGLEIAEISRRRGTLQFLGSRIAETDLEIHAQEKELVAASERVEAARAACAEARRELEVLEKHREDWIEEQRLEARRREARTLEEIVTNTHGSGRRARSRPSTTDPRGRPSGAKGSASDSYSSERGNES